MKEITKVQNVYYGACRYQIAGSIALAGLVIGSLIVITQQLLIAFPCGLAAGAFTFWSSRIAFKQNPDRHFKIQKWMDEKMGVAAD